MNGTSYQKLADKYGVSKRTIQNAVKGKTWKCVTYMPEAPEGMTAEEYMRICTAMISVCDGIWVLPNYWNSAGTKIEISLCEYFDKPVKYLSGEDWFDYDEWRREEWSV